MTEQDGWGAYRAKHDSTAVASRIRGLLSGCAPARSLDYVTLAGPDWQSTNHARATYYMLDWVSSPGTPAPHFNTIPPATTRLYAAASRGMLEFAFSEMAAAPSSIDEVGRWNEVRDSLRRAEKALHPDVRAAVGLQILVRLGLLADAARVVAQMGGRELSYTDPILGRLSLTLDLRSDLPRDRIQRSLLAAMQEVERTPLAWIEYAVVYMVLRGQSRTTDEEFRRVIDEARIMTQRLEVETPYAHLITQGVLRAAAFEPFVRGDVNGALDLLAEAKESQSQAEFAALNWRDRVACADYAFPLYQTLARTHLASGDYSAARDSALNALVISPNDERGWEILGDVCYQQGDLMGAIECQRQVIAAGSYPAIRAFYRLGTLYRQQGEDDMADEVVDVFRRLESSSQASGEEK